MSSCPIQYLTADQYANGYYSWSEYAAVVSYVAADNLLLLFLLSQLFDRIAVLRTYMRSTVTDQVAWSVGLSVCLSH